MKQKIEIICVHCGCLVENCACNKIDWRVIAYGRKQDVKQLEAENKRLREALELIAEGSFVFHYSSSKVFKIVKSALEGEK
jgi:hypothetical protein